MGLLGKIGIDWGLVLAQVLNFLVLLWFLHRFLYRPLLKGMENSDLEEAEREMKKVHQEQEAVEAARAKAVDEARKKSSSIVAVAEKIAAEVQETAREKAEEQKKEILAQADTLLESQKGAVAAAREEQARATAVATLEKIWAARLADEAVAKPLQAAYWASLLSDVRGVEPTAIGAGPVVLETTWPVTDGELAALRQVLAEKFGSSDTKITVNRDPSLLVGCRLELDGFEVQANLHSDIHAQA